MKQIIAILVATLFAFGITGISYAKKKPKCEPASIMKWDKDLEQCVEKEKKDDDNHDDNDRDKDDRRNNDNDRDNDDRRN